jgi:hypothetical protein
LKRMFHTTVFHVIASLYPAATAGEVKEKKQL